MIRFYELKRALFFPQIAGFMRSKNDVPYLLDLLMHERVQSRQTRERAVEILNAHGYKDTAARVHADYAALDKVYEHDIALCSQFMVDNHINPIG